MPDSTVYRNASKKRMEFLAYTLQKEKQYSILMIV